jgi:hypothetical protein
LRDLIAWWQAGEVSGTVIGGVAASLLGRPRLTRDVDAIIFLEEQRWESFLATGAHFGFLARRPDALEFARQSHVLLVRHETSGIDVDLVIGTLAFEREIISRATSVPIADVALPLPTPEDLIIMKAVAHRPRDMTDIESILDAHPQLDVRRVRQWVRDFSTSLGMPDISRDLERILRRRSKRKKSMRRPTRRRKSDKR